MTKRHLVIDPDVRSASTLPSEIYADPASYRLQVERVMARSWHLVSAVDPVPDPATAAPLTLLPGCLDEPLVATRERDGTRQLLSNVCTHRANLVATERCSGSLRCRYHGRRFGLDGRMLSMPEFEQALAFPSPADDLPRVPSASLGPMLFAGVEPAVPFDELIEPVRSRLSFVPWDRLAIDPATSRDYDVAAHWALYCDNYLEGFHIPFVHAALNEALDYGGYATELFPWGTVQVGVAKQGDDVLDLPASHPDHGERVAALYFFVFPTTMLNVYPWGISVNAVQPTGPSSTRVSFVSLVHDPSLRARGAGGDLHSVELEDEAVVEAVQRGVRSRFYRSGRYSPTRETGVHHFHRLLVDAIG